MDGEQKRSGWKIWLYMTPLYVLLAVPLYRWTLRLNSGDVAIDKADYNAFNSQEGEVKKTENKEYDPGLSDTGYAVRYRSGKEGTGDGAVTGGDSPAAKTTDQTAQAAPSQKARPAAAAQPAGRAQLSNQAALESKDTSNKAQMGFGNQKGYLTYAVGKTMNNPKAVGALFNNSWVVKGFMARDTVKAALGSPQGLQNYLSNPKNISNFLNNSVVQAAMNNQAVVNTFASSGMAGAILASPAVQGLMQNPETLTSVLANNPQLAQTLSNPNVMNALMSNPQTAGLAASLGGGATLPKR